MTPLGDVVMILLLAAGLLWLVVKQVLGLP